MADIEKKSHREIALENLQKEGLSKRTAATLWCHYGATSVASVASLTERDIRNLPSTGMKAVREINEALYTHFGVCLKHGEGLEVAIKEAEAAVARAEVQLKNANTRLQELALQWYASKPHKVNGEGE